MALRKTLSVVLFLLADRGLASPQDLTEIAAIIAEDLAAKSAAEPEGSLRSEALAAAGPVVTDLVAAALSPLPPSDPASAPPKPPWPTRPETAALEGILGALIVASIRGKPEATKRFELLHRVARECVGAQPWPEKAPEEAQNLRRDAQAEADRSLLVVAELLGIALEPGGAEEAATSEPGEAKPA
ncbi:MAG: hypothetical protein Kilf2KO_29460 [Rhodospirillales bacterium]